MVDRNDLYKAKHKQTPEKPGPDNSGLKENGKFSNERKGISPRVRRENFKAFQERLRVSDVVKSVLG